jgi:aromatic-amino-acid transaminase
MEFLIPSRATRPGDDPIFALNGEARARAAQGESVVNATVGSLLEDDGTLATMRSVVEALSQVPPKVAAAYAPIAGSPAFLRGVIGDLLGGTPLESAAVAVATPGGTGALRHAIANFLEPKQAALTTSFYWGPYKTLADESDRALATFRMFDGNGGLDVEALDVALERQLRQQGRALLLLNSPCHNPTGYSFTTEEWRSVAAVLRRHQGAGAITVCLDVAYAKFGGEEGLRTMFAELGSLLPHVLLLVAWSASKTFLQYGLRIGSLVAIHPDATERKRIEAALTYSCRGTWSNVNAGGMAAISELLSRPELRAKVDAERAACVELLGRRVARFNELAGPRGLRYPRYDGGFFTTVFTPDAQVVSERLKARGVFVVPQEGAIRIALCSVREADIPRLVDEVAAALPA